VAQLLGIGPLLDSRPDTLSGGEKQKVALARAIAVDPELLLLDEPLGALDPQTREGVQQELVQLHDELGITVLHVTHDFEEAISMGDRIAVMGEGAIRQVGAPEEVFRHPSSEFVARFTMAGNVFSGEAAKDGNGRNTFVSDGMKFVTNSDIEGPCCASIRSEDILIHHPPGTTHSPNEIGAPVTRIIHKGTVVQVIVSLPSPLTCLLTRHDYEDLNLYVGEPVIVTVSPAAVHLFFDWKT
jgi:ABC-type Fe3+/spermidine/putrescine transport system ATPase subunit